jgi:YHS domain-containing protein
VRVVLLLAVAVLVLTVLLPLLRRPLARGPRRPVALSDELVKDPVCQTYVVRSRAVRGGGAADAPYFCSEECARRYVG